MSKKAKADFVATDKTVADRHNVKNPGAKTPVSAPEPVTTKLPPPDDAMVRQILERQAAFGF
jgi:hypothetical protein